MSNEELVQLIQQNINTASNMELLYEQNKGLIFSIVRKFRYACQADYSSTAIIELDELIHEAYFGLIKAVESYEPSHGVLFMSYTPYWIRQAIKRYLENCGRVVRVPVHRQQQIYQYNQATSYYLQSYNREPDIYEYASWLGVTVKTIEDIKKYMFQGIIKSLDEFLPGDEGDSLTIADSVASDVDIESDVIEKVGNEQMHTQLWELVGQVLKDDKKVQIIKLRYVDNLTMEAIGKKFNISKSAVRQMIVYCSRLIRRNTAIRRLSIELGFWELDKPFNIERVKERVEQGRTNWLSDNELKYAIRMGWIKEDVLQVSV